MRTRTSTAGLLTAVILACSIASIASVPASSVSAAGETAQLPTADPANFTPNVLDGQVESIWQVGATVVIGGTFTSVANAAINGSQVYERTHLAAFDAVTGKVEPGFAPSLNGRVSTVIPAGDGTIYIGGDFTTVNGVTRRKVARLDLATGSLVSAFDAGGINGLVRDMRLVGGSLYISGLFTTVGGSSRTHLASLDPASGAVTPKLNLTIEDPWNGGSVNVFKIDVTPAGNRMLIIGNFRTVGGESRHQIALLDLSTTPVSVNPWNTDFYSFECSNTFDSYMRDLDISDDGTFAVISTTGEYRAGTSCDTNSRLELTAEVAGVAPTWINYTGGDTSYAVQIHHGVAYIGGHMRWVNNPSAGDRAGQGAVPRSGMAALDVVTGLPFSWNPGRDRGIGVFDYHVTSEGLWAGSDTDRWNSELRQKLAFFRWKNGSLVPANSIGALPNKVVLLGQSSGTTGADPSVLYRVNAGGPALASVDDGPDWAADTGASSPYRNSGSTATAYALTAGTWDATVPTADFDRPPAALWATERWDSASDPEMVWNFDVPAGTPIQVRLYLANKSNATNETGERVFDIDVDGTNVVNDLDLSNRPGHNVATMRTFDTVSDGQVNILFRHQVENPLINGIEIIRSDASKVGTLGSQDQIRTVGGFGSGSPPTASGWFAGTAPWHTVRGAFMVNSTLFTIHSDGTLVRRGFDGTTFGPGTATFTYANGILAEAGTMTGIFFDPATSRIYYTLSTADQLYYRSFLPESRVIGATRYTATGTVAALGPARVRGMFLSDGQIWFGDAASGELLRIGFANGSVSGGATLADASVDWRARAMFLTSVGAANVAPTAAFTQECFGTTCVFDSSASADSDGTIELYAWDFGDGQTDTGISPTHSYAAPGVYTVTLTVTDSDSATSTVRHAVSVTLPVAGSSGYASLASPARILDTRAEGTTADGQQAALGIRPLGTTLQLPVAARAGVPADAAAVVLNVTVTEAQGAGFITAYPCGAPRPTASNLNYVAGQTVPNLVIAKIGADGSICLFNSAATHLVADVAGFFPGLDTFTPLPAPARLLDTRGDGLTVDGALLGEGRRGAGTVQVLPVATRAGVPAGVASVVLNVTVDDPETAGFITVYPCDAPMPTASNVNYAAGQVVPNAAVAKLAADGTVCLYTSATTHLIVDLAGFVAESRVVVPLTAPARLLDTRSDGSTVDGMFVGTGLRPTGGTIQLRVGGRAGVPATASAVVLNVTVDQTVAPGFVTVYPAEGGRPNASNLNYVAGHTVPNAVVARLGSGGTLCLFNSGPTHLVVDIAAYITGPAPAAAGLACPPDP